MSLAVWSEMNAGKVVHPKKDAAAEHLSKDDGSGMVPSPRGPTGPGLRALGLTWAVLDVQSLGYGSVAWIQVSPGAQNVGVAARGVGLRIGETGQVPEIEIENLGDTAVLVPAHLVLSGGWQTRAVERSAVVPARHTARVPVKCIEAGRWAPRDERTGSTFEVAERTSVRTRWSTSVNMSEQLTRHGRFTAEQSAVWQHVEEELARTPEPSHTRSYEAYLRGVKRRHIEAVRAVRVRPPAEANAVVLFLRGGGVWMEAYPTPAALAEHAEDLLADLFDASAKHETDVVEAPPVEALLDALWQLPTREVERIAGTLGAPRVIDGLIELPEWAALASVTGSLLTIDGALAHLSVGAPPGRIPARPVAAAAASQRPGASSAGVSHEADASHLATSPVAAGSHSASAIDGSAASPGARPVGLHVVANLDAVAGRSSAEGAHGRAAPGARGEPAAPSRSDARVVALVPRGHAPTPGGPKISRETMRVVYERARELVPDLPIAPQEVRGYRLLRALDGNVSWVDICVGSDAYAVLGSHDRCDLVLGDDTGIWLRHLLAGCVRLPDGSIGVRMIDLKTDIPFYLEDDAPQWSVTASGPFAIRLGRHVICGFPLGEASTLASEPPTGAVTFSASAFASGSIAVPAQTFPSLVRVDTAAPVRRRMGEPFTIVPSAPVSQIQDLIGPSSSPNHVRVTLERGGMGASVEIPAAALDAGVLLGRALNCFDGGLRRIFCDAVSRAHVLLLADQGEVFALDLCTTNGTRVAGRRIRRYRLANEGATLELGKKVLFRWHRRVTLPAPNGDGGTSGPADR